MSDEYEGYPPDAEEVIVDLSTTEGIMRVQGILGITVDGIMGPITREAMTRVVSDALMRRGK